MSSKKPDQARPDLQRLIDLQAFLEKFHHIDRRIFHAGKKTRRESDTEHTYVLAMAAWYLSNYFSELDRDLCIRIALAHDLVEVHAGDTYIYADKETLAGKAKRELAALKQIEQDWPDFADLTETIHDYEKRTSKESCFIYALDKIMPIILIFLGKGHTWRAEGVTLKMLVDKKTPQVALSPQAEHYFTALVTLLESHQHYFPSKANQH